MADVSSMDKLRDLYMPEHNLSSDDLNRSNIVHQQVRRQNEDVVLRSVKQSLHDADLHYLSPVLARMRQHQQQQHEEHIQPLMNASQASPRTSWMEEEDDVEPMLQDGLVMDGLSQHRRDVAVMEMMKLHAPDVLEPVSPAYSQRMNESTATAAAMLRSTCRVVGGDVAGSDGLGTSSLAAHRNVSTPVGAAAPLGDAPHTYAQMFANNNASIHGRSTPATSSPRATAGGVKKHMSRLALKDLYTADVDEDEVGDATTTWEEKEAMEVLRQEQTNRLVVSSSPPPPIREDDGTFTAPSSLPTSQRSADVVVECSNTMMMSGGNLDGSMNLQPRKPLWLRHSLPRHAPQQAQRASVGGDTSSASMMMELDAPFSATLLHRGGSTFNCTTEDLFLTQLNQSRLFYSAGSLPPIMAAPLMEGRQRDLKVLDVVRDSMSRRGPISSSAQRRKHR